MRHQGQIDFDSGSGPRRHLAGGTRQPGRAHILDARNCAAAHCLEAGFEQKFFQKRIADLHRWPFLERGFIKFSRRHRCSVNPVSSRFGAHVQDRITDAGCFTEEDLISAHQSERECVDEWIQRVSIVERHFTTNRWHAKSVTVVCNAGDDPGEQ